MSSQVLKYFNTATSQWEPIVVGTQGPPGGPAETGPDFIYTSGVLTRIDYDSGNHKIFTYSSGTLTRIDYIRPGTTTIRKDFFYDVNGLLDYINQSEF